MIDDFTFINSHFFISFLKGKIADLKNSETPIIIRRGECKWNQKEWYSFLKSECYLQEDKRHFGLEENLTLSEWWEISYQPNKASSYAYSKTRQPLHTDNAWFEDGADINFFVMKKQAITGGEQFIYPVSRLIEDLEKDSPLLLEDLKNIQVTIQKGDTELKNETTILKKKRDRYHIFWNFYRTLKNDSTVDKMCNSFFKYLEKKENTVSIERIWCNSGDCFAFNDSLLLHGRDSFEAYKPFDRILLQSMWNMSKK